MFSGNKLSRGSSSARAVRALKAQTKEARRMPHPGNVEGEFYVDHTCIDCDTCRWMAPDVFSREASAGQSVVTAQPSDAAGRRKATKALLSCPTYSIHFRKQDAAEVADAQAEMPILVEGCENVFHCGYHSEKSFGAASYFIKRENGNILMDSPRFHPKLAQQLDAMGGVQLIVLSHIDDVADHDRWAKYFGAPRIIHETEIVPAMADVEVQLSGSGPWNLSGETVSEGALDGGVQLVHVPGHTAGCICLYHEPSRTMFTGDHLGYSGQLNRLTVFPRYNRYGVDNQVESVEKLLKYDFSHVLPGHGRRYSLGAGQQWEDLFRGLRLAEVGK